MAVPVVAWIVGGRGCVPLGGCDFFWCGGVFAMLANVVFYVHVGVFGH